MNTKDLIIHHPKDNKQEELTDYNNRVKSTTTFYDSKGEVVLVSKSKTDDIDMKMNILAKHFVGSNGLSFYYVRVDKRRRLMNVVELKGSQIDLTRKAHGTYLIEVKEGCFKHYLKFLQTKQSQYLAFAERSRISS